MKTKSILYITVIVIGTTLLSCKKETPTGPGGNPLNTASLADILQEKLDGATVGYAFAISYREDLSSFRDGGEARRSQDPPARAMSTLEKYSCASVSKTVTAAALLKLLSELDEVGLNSTIAAFLPAHWHRGPGINTVTFRELLRHESGFRSGLEGIGNGDDYATLKALIANGINLADKSTPSYNNRNYAILRLIIPRLEGRNILNLTGQSGIILHTGELAQATLCANYYREYVKKVVFDKVGLYDADVKYTEQAPPLYYAFPSGSEKGSHVGDLTLLSGGRGWVMSTLEMSLFFRALHYTNDILPASLGNQMIANRLGYDVTGTTNDGVSYYWKNGIHVSDLNGYRSLIIGFGNDIQIAIMTNSPINLQDNAIAAFEEWYQ